MRINADGCSMNHRESWQCLLPKRCVRVYVTKCMYFNRWQGSTSVRLYVSVFFPWQVSETRFCDDLPWPSSWASDHCEWPLRTNVVCILVSERNQKPNHLPKKSFYHYFGIGTDFL